MKRKHHSVRVNIDVDLDDIADQIPDEEILKWAADIQTHGGGKQAVVAAINEMRAGRLADAVTTLEREFLPKWADRADCQVAYDRAMGREA